MKGFDVLHVMWQGVLGGAERAVYQLALHQHQDGRRRVALGYGQAVGEWCDAARRAGIPVVDFGLRSTYDLAGVAAGLRHLHHSRIHHFHSLEPTLMGASCVTAAKGRVYTHRAGRARYDGKQAVRYRVVRPFMGRYTVTGNTSHAVTTARALFDLDARAHVATTYNGMDLSLLEASTARADMRRALRTPDATVVIGTAANLRAWKRIDWLIEACTQLPTSDWVVWVLGEGPDRGRLEALAQASGSGDRFIFHGKQHHMGDWLRAMDVFVLPSGPEESFGNAAVEAMACGIPTVVAADSPGMVEHVVDGESGLVFDGVGHLARLLESLIADSRLRERIGTAGEARIRDRYSMQRAVDRYESVYQRLDPR